MTFKKTKFLSEVEIESAILEAAEICEKEHIEIVLAGGAAMQVYGSPRLTKDVDFLASEVPKFFNDRVHRKLSFGGVAGVSRKNVPVDYIVRDDESAGLYVFAIKNAIETELPIRVVSPEFMAALKLEAGRVKDEEDLRFLISSGAINRTLARNIIKNTLGAYAAKSFDSYVYEVDWRTAQEKT